MSATIRSNQHRMPKLAKLTILQYGVGKQPTGHSRERNTPWVLICVRRLLKDPPKYRLTTRFETKTRLSVPWLLRGFPENITFRLSCFWLAELLRKGPA